MSRHLCQRIGLRPARCPQCWEEADPEPEAPDHDHEADRAAGVELEAVRQQIRREQVAYLRAHPERLMELLTVPGVEWDPVAVQIVTLERQAAA